MDPISQGVVGAALPQSVNTGARLKTITWLGCLAGMAPDIDVFFQSPTDPLLFLEFHRQFTHALVFIPIGALICATLAFRFARAQLSFAQVYVVCLLAYATHGLLDACTTYGTQLLWPFSDARIAWNNVSVIDPLFTLPVLALVVLTVRRQQPIYSRIALAFGISYLLFGVVQRERAEDVGAAIAAERGHTPVRLEAKPGFANLFLWKVVYETETKFHVDAVRLFWTPKAFPGDAADKLNVARDLPWLDPASQQARDIERFDWFSNRYLAIDPTRPNYVIDVRYSVIPNEINALWGIELDPSAGPEQHVEYITNRSGSAGRISQLAMMMLE